MTNDRALNLGEGRNIIMRAKLALGLITTIFVCSSGYAQEVTLRAVSSA